MNSLHPLWIHDSLRAAALRQKRIASLTSGQIDPALHYLSPRQAELWLAVHRAHAPRFATQKTPTLYESASLHLAHSLAGKPLHVIGLGAGGGTKESLLLSTLQRAGCPIRYTPLDASVELAIVSAEAAAPFVSEPSTPVAADLQLLAAGPSWIGSPEDPAPRVYTAFGLTPNLDPATLFPLLRSALRPGDRLLLSANLAPWTDPPGDVLQAPLATGYRQACERILPQYENPETRLWLRQALLDWGLHERLGPLEFSIEPRGPLFAITVSATWLENAAFLWEGSPLEVSAGDRLGVFFSLRYTPARMERLAREYGLRPEREFLTECAQEGVWSFVAGQG
ncbi:MAG: hypothetical protein RLZZ244_999 [Verrucomicrobiota bacterium]|jgi:hypothetical protein